PEPQGEPATGGMYGLAGEAVGAVAEPVGRLVSGAVAKPLSDVAGIGAMTVDAAAHLAGLTKYPGDLADPTKGHGAVQRALTYQPRTQAGASEWNPLNAVPHAIGSILEWARQHAEGAIMPSEKMEKESPVRAEIRRGVARAVGAGVEQLPLLLGLKGAP